MSPIRHDALIYGSDDEFARVAAPFVADGVAEGAGVVVATTPHNRDVLVGALGRDAESVTFVASSDVYATLPSAIRAYHQAIEGFLGRGHQSVRAIGEVVYPDDIGGWLDYESVAHAVFAESPLHVVCPYDTRSLPPALIDHAQYTHPHLRDDSGCRANDAFVEPVEYLRRTRHAPAMPERPPELQMRITGSGDLASGRRAVADALRGPLRPRRAEEAALVASELMTNGLLHGGAEVDVAVWSLDDGVVLAVQNDGVEVDDPLAGFRPPLGSEHGGMGLWVARHLSDDLHIGAANGVGTVVTAFFRDREPRD